MIRPAATLMLVRGPMGQRRVLMGQRGRQAVFMPEKFVFPGGAVDAGDEDAPCPHADDICITRLSAFAQDASPSALLSAAERELREETGLCLDGAQSLMVYAFRALTPPGRPRRYDARFFVMDADGLTCDLDDFSNADGELSHLAWIPLEETKTLNLAFITQVVLAQLRGMAHIAPPASVPYFENTEDHSVVRQIV
ncbi:MAG: NUDIX hydrolase [Planktomarina sp.]